jgi:hypothetical protein
MLNITRAAEYRYFGFTYYFMGKAYSGMAERTCA